MHALYNFLLFTSRQEQVAKFSISSTPLGLITEHQVHWNSSCFINMFRERWINYRKLNFLCIAGKHLFAFLDSEAQCSLLCIIIYITVISAFRNTHVCYYIENKRFFCIYISTMNQRTNKWKVLRFYAKYNKMFQELVSSYLHLYS